MHTHFIPSLLLATALALPGTALAQPPDTRAIVLSAAPIYLQPGAQVPLRVAKAGTSLRVLQEEGDWAEVEFNDPQFGRRVGWVEKKLIRISRPGLEPMDLSVKDPEVAAPVMPASQAPPPPSGLRPQVREGFFFNIGLGYGSLGCQDCLTRDDGLSGGLSLGSAISDHVLLGVGTTGFGKEVGGDLLTVGTLDVRVRVYPVRTSGFFLNGGVGLGSISFAGESEIGLGVMLGVGWDIRQGSNVSLTPFWNGFAMSNSNADANVGQLGIGITIH